MTTGRINQITCVKLVKRRTNGANRRPTHEHNEQSFRQLFLWTVHKQSHNRRLSLSGKYYHLAFARETFARKVKSTMKQYNLFSLLGPLSYTVKRTDPRTRCSSFVHSSLALHEFNRENFHKCSNRSSSVQPS